VLLPPGKVTQANFSTVSIAIDVYLASFTEMIAPDGVVGRVDAAVVVVVCRTAENEKASSQEVPY
jgi:hypothetical protein